MELVKEGNGYVYRNEQGELLAEITYTFIEENVIDANHTFVDEKLRGQGIAKQLVDHLANVARQQQWTVHATCPYIVRLFNETTEYNDIKATK